MLSSHVRLGPAGQIGPAIDTAAALGDLGLDLAIVTLQPPHDPAVLAPLADALAQLRDTRIPVPRDPIPQPGPSSNTPEYQATRISFVILTNALR